MTTLPDVFRQIPMAHRALHDKSAGRPENSRAAIRAAIDKGYGIEIDLQTSRDGRAMVFHDYDLRRLTTEKGSIHQRDSAELGRIKLRHCDEGIPTFTEVLDLVAGRVPLLVELKDQHGQMGLTDGRLESAVAADLTGYSGPVAVMSFNPNSVKTLAGLIPDIPRGIVTSTYARTNKNWRLLRADVRDRLRDIPDYDSSKSSFISHQVNDLANPRVAELKAQGAAILCWTVRSARQEAKARKLADNITFEGYLADMPL